MIKNFNQIVTEIQAHLVDYLEEQGIDTKKNFSCVNPKHEDSNPSCSILPGSNRIYCHGCSARYDIFDILNIKEKKPLTGALFITDTLQYLANKYNIIIEMDAMTEEKINELAVYRAYKTVADYISTQTKVSKLALAEVKRRKWSSKTLLETYTGYVPSYKDYLFYLTSSGYTEEDLKDYDLDRGDIFNENNIIFTICDDKGNPVGFAARNLKYNKADPNTNSKYINQRTSNTKYNIYQKGKRLYGFNLAKDEPDPIYIFEGQGDVLTARENGLHNSCAIGSTALTTDHVLLLKEHNKYHIVLCLDSDEAGQSKTEKLLDTRFAGHKDIRVSIVLIPNGLDPDDFIRESGIEEFRKLAVWSAFEWRLNRFPDKSDPNEITKAMIPFIITEPSYITQEDMCKQLSLSTGYSLQAIQSEVSRLQNAHEERKATERRTVVEKALRDAMENPDNAEMALTTARTRLFELSKKYNEDEMSEETCLKELLQQQSIQESKTDKFSGFVLGNDMYNLQQALAGEWDKDVLMVFGGKANAGKTALCAKLSYSIASHEENDAIVVYHTIDDTAEQLIPRLVTIAEGTKQLTINHVKDPNYWSKIEGTELLHKRKLGYTLVENLVKNGRLIIKDANHGTTLAYVETLINYYQERYPNRRLVYILDNFHKLTDNLGNGGDERIRFKTLSKAIKGLATTYHIPIICTCEYTKLPMGTKPGNNNISETVSIEYDTNFIAHVYNDLHEFGPNATMYHTVLSKEGEIQRMPRMEVIIGKNKITSFKNSIYYDFFPASSDFIGIDEAVIAEQIEEAKKEKKLSNEKSGKTTQGSLYDN